MASALQQTVNKRRAVRWLKPLRAFRSRNYQLFFAGQAISLLGMWMQRTAMVWLVYRLTGSPFLLGVVAFCTLVPNLFLGPIAGMVADRFDKKRMLIIAQVAEALQALILAILVVTDLVQVWHLIALGLMLGIAGSFETPLRQAFIIDMLSRRSDLPNAIALNSTMFNGARLIGPAAAGLLIDAFGEEICFGLNALSFIAVIYALVLIKPRISRRSPNRESIMRGMIGGFAYSFSRRNIRDALALLAVTSFIAMPYLTLLPIFADQIIGGGARTLGFLTSATGIGAVSGALFLAIRGKGVFGLRRLVIIATMLFGVSLIAFSYTTSFWLAMALMVATGASMMTQVAACNTLIQAETDDDKRGRVMSHYAMAIVGITPFGSLFAGWLADYIGVQMMVLIGGVSILLVGMLGTMWKK